MKKLDEFFDAKFSLAQDREESADRHDLTGVDRNNDEPGGAPVGGSSDGYRA